MSETEALAELGYEIRDLWETDISLFKEWAECWEVTNLRPEDLIVEMKVENSTEPKLILFMNNTQENLVSTPVTQTLYLKVSHSVRVPHQSAIGSLKLWSSDGDFSDGSTLTIEIFITSGSIEKMKELDKLEKPCFTMKIPQTQQRIQRDFEYIYFGESHNFTDLFLIMKVSIHHTHGGQSSKPKLLALRDFTLHFSNESQHVTYSQAKCPLGQAPDQNLVCQDCAESCDVCFGTKPSQCLSCSPERYWHGSECTHCHGFCQSCAGPTQHECLGCTAGFYDYENGTCLDYCYWPFREVRIGVCQRVCKSNEYAWSANETCFASCPAPFVSSIDNDGFLSCYNPCARWDKFTYLNGLCTQACPFPLVIESYPGVKFCKSPCSSASDYLYPDQSCHKECKAPLKIRSDSIANYCENPCESEDPFFYINGSCLSHCPDPLVTEIEYRVKFCKNPCGSASEYLFVNRLCSKECPFPLQIRAEPGVKYCESPCHSENLFLAKNGSCLSTCQFPLVAVFEDSGRHCRNPCHSKSDYLCFNGSCIKECSFPLQIRTEPIANFCVNPCPLENLYLYQNGSCFSTCKTPLVAVFESKIRYCRNPCQSRSDYLYANRSCLKECPAPLQARFEPIVNYCENPCHSMNHYLYYNGSCLLTCPFPLKIREGFGVKYCLPPCRMTGEYILRDGSCSAECPVPLIQRTEKSIGTFCLSPCQSKDDFIVGNESCRPDCPRYFESKVQYGVKYCRPPCLDDQYYLPQYRACVDVCSHPFKITQEEGINLCGNQCSSLGDFIYDDQSCHQGCPMPLRIEESNHCKSPCLEEYVNSDGSCQESCEYPYTIFKQGPYRICQISLKRTQSTQILTMREIVQISNTLSELGGILSCLINTGDPTSLLMMPLLEMFQKVAYTDIVLPENTKFILIKQFRKSFDEKVGIIFVIMALLISGLLKMTGSSHGSKFYQLLVKWDLVLRWNTLIPLFISLSGDLILDSLIEFKKYGMNSLRCIFYISLTILTGTQIYKMSRVRIRGEDIARWRFLFDIVSENHGCFFLIYFVRMTVFQIIIGLLSDSPHLQAFSMILLSFGMCSYLIWLSPIKRTFSKVQYMVVELALLFYNFTFGILAIFDFKESSVIDVFGQLMNILYLIPSILTAIIILLKIVYIIYSHCKVYNTSRAPQPNNIQLSEMNQENTSNSPPESVRFEPLNQEEINTEDQNNIDSEDDSIEPSIAVE